MSWLGVANGGLSRLDGYRVNSCWTAAMGSWSRGNHHIPAYLASHGAVGVANRGTRAIDSRLFPQGGENPERVIRVLDEPVPLKDLVGNEKAERISNVRDTPLTVEELEQLIGGRRPGRR
jgi:hypothetical protein